MSTSAISFFERLEEGAPKAILGLAATGLAVVLVFLLGFLAFGIEPSKGTTPCYLLIGGLFAPLLAAWLSILHWATFCLRRLAGAQKWPEIIAEYKLKYGSFERWFSGFSGE